MQAQGLDPEKRYSQEELNELLQIRRDKLKELQTEVNMELTRERITVDRLTLRQQEGFKACMPCGYNAFASLFERVLPASAVANLYPFNYSGKTDPNGFYIGKDRYGTNILVDFDRRASDKTNANILILGNCFFSCSAISRYCRTGKNRRLRSYSYRNGSLWSCWRYNPQHKPLGDCNLQLYRYDRGRKRRCFQPSPQCDRNL